MYHVRSRFATSFCFPNDVHPSSMQRTEQSFGQGEAEQDLAIGTQPGAQQAGYGEKKVASGAAAGQAARVKKSSALGVAANRRERSRFETEIGERQQGLQSPCYGIRNGRVFSRIVFPCDEKLGLAAGLVPDCQQGRGTGKDDAVAQQGRYVALYGGGLPDRSTGTGFRSLGLPRGREKCRRRGAGQDELRGFEGGAVFEQDAVEISAGPLQLIELIQWHLRDVKLGGTPAQHIKKRFAADSFGLAGPVP